MDKKVISMDVHTEAFRKAMAMCNLADKFKPLKTETQSQKQARARKYMESLERPTMEDINHVQTR